MDIAPLPSLNDEFNSVFPPGWGTTIIGKKIVEGEDKFPNVELHFFINCTNEEEFGKWLMEFENSTSSSYVIACTDVENGAKLKLKRRLRCHHSTRCTKTYNPSLKNKTRNTNCPSKITVKIHVIRKKYRGKKENFQLLQEAPCEVKLILTHNHMTNTADSLRFRKVSKNVREELLSLYKNGHTAGTALEMIKCNIQLTRDDYVTALADRNICPTYKYCYDLYMKEFKENYGPMKFDTEAKMFLENNLTLYNAEKRETITNILEMFMEVAKIEEDEKFLYKVLL
ncbi:unnamed protein product [Psylliodes chrysocephalus]|uniref:Uncharacterized protein n=1 Tax=Psylliodes chrysocephalus TaxID=3402493 RepID=A0A9P0G613_9CUCU|nr:unnamed protein product [Psylliodes chrysocephala]